MLSDETLSLSLSVFLSILTGAWCLPSSVQRLDGLTSSYLVTQYGSNYSPCYCLFNSSGWLAVVWGPIPGRFMRIAVLLMWPQGVMSSEGGMRWGVQRNGGGMEGRIVWKGLRGSGLLLTTDNVVSGGCGNNQWLITIKLFSRRKWPSIAAITLITTDTTSDKEESVVNAHVCISLCVTSLCVFSYKQQTSEPSCSFHPEVSILSFRSFRSPGALCFSWLGCVSLLKLRCSTAVAGWMCSLQRWQATDLMRSRLVHPLWYWHFSRLHRAATALFIAVLPKLAYNANGG